MTDDVVRKLMYGQQGSTTEKKDVKGIKVNESQKVVVIENGGVRYQVPSVRLVESLVQENSRLKSELMQVRTDIKKLTEALKKMDNSISGLEREMATKADIYGND